ncbi:hypothetical protein KJA15_03490 [Patescibacteria group bacterium]|nr:hypothetical protein [Patescibacteria group bacterium]
MENISPTIAGWIGMAFILIAYYLVSTKKVTGESQSYQLLNLFGAIGIVWNTFVQKAWPAMALNIVWAIIALKTLLLTRKNGP